MPQRFLSLDVFRGATVALMILVNNPGSWSHIYSPLAHAKWHGATPTDLVFPFFLFAVGNAMAFVLPRFEHKPALDFWKKIGWRTLLIFTIGLLLNAFPFVRYDSDGLLVPKTLDKLRIMGVLQRIALCYFFAAALIRWLGDKGSAFASSSLLIVYWVICLALGGNDPYSLEGFFGTQIDLAILGESHLYRGEGVAFDPEGLISTMPAMVQVIIGYLTGRYILRKGMNWEMLSHLFAVSMLLIFAGLCWNLSLPINKKIWTSSYVLYTGGLAMTVLAMGIWLIEFKNSKGAWCSFFEVFGKNPLFIFVLSGVVAKSYALFRIHDGMQEGKEVFLGLGAWMYKHLFSPALGPMNGSLAYALAHILLFWAIGFWLDKKTIYIRV